LLDDPEECADALVAEAGTDGDLVSSLGTPTAQHGSARLGLHAGEEPVSFGAVAAVGLEGTLRHSIRLLLKLIEYCNGNSLSVYRGLAAAAKKGD
jgi:hypothetical protein